MSCVDLYLQVFCETFSTILMLCVGVFMKACSSYRLLTLGLKSDGKGGEEFGDSILNSY